MSSRHNGPKASANARGKRYAREVVERPDAEVVPSVVTDKEVVQMLQEDGVSTIRKLMRPHDQLAVDTLAEVAGDKDASPSSRVTAATRILEWSHGKPVPIVGKTAGLGTGSGLKIQILQFYGDSRGAVATAVDVESESVEILKE